MLTGESTASEKEVVSIEQTVPIGDRINMVFSGTIITYGRGKFLVTATGNNTEIGEVAGLLESTTEQVTPLQRGLEDVYKRQHDFLSKLIHKTIHYFHLKFIFCNRLQK